MMREATVTEQNGRSSTSNDEDEESNILGHGAEERFFSTLNLALLDGTTTTTTTGDQRRRSGSLVAVMENENENVENGEDVFALMQKVSSCFFSVSSEVSVGEEGSVTHKREDDDDEWLLYDNDDDNERDNEVSDSTSKHRTATIAAKEDRPDHATRWTPVDVLCHDIMMCVLSFLPNSSIAAFSETARRPNFECFYYLQLQLEHAILWKMDDDGNDEEKKESDHDDNDRANDDGNENDDNGNNDRANDDGNENDDNGNNDGDNAIFNDEVDVSYYDSPKSFGEELPAESARVVSRLATLSPAAAEDLVRRYADSNSSLRLMTLSRRIASLRYALSQGRRSQTTTKAAGAAAALFGLSVGAYASSCYADAAQAGGQALFSMVLAALVKTASDSKKHPNKQQQEPQQQQQQQDGSRNDPSIRTPTDNNVDAVRQEDQERTNELYAMEHPISPNPYEHLMPLSAPPNEKGESITKSISSLLHYYYKAIPHPTPGGAHPSDSASSTTATSPRRQPTGCVGAFVRTVRAASRQVVASVKEARAARFETLPFDERARLSSALVEACATDANLPLVVHLVRRRGVDVDAPALGPDGLDVRPVHVAALHGAVDVLAFLCARRPRPVDDDDDDGGLADPDARDENGWTAAHFAAGDDSVRAVRVLRSSGADLAVEAANGYTPWQWADRLSNHAVRAELARYGADRTTTVSSLLPSLSVVAERIMGAVPTTTTTTAGGGGVDDDDDGGAE